MKLDIELYAEGEYGPGKWAQERYLYHGLEDVLWSSSLADIIATIALDLKNFEARQGLRSRIEH